MTPPSPRLSAEERRIHILEAALNVFSRLGFSGARTKEIAREAGVSETLIFRHFESKENLYRQALDHLFSGHPVEDELIPALAAEDDRQVLYLLASHIMKHTEEDQRIVRLSLFSGLEGLGIHQHEDMPMKALADYLARRMAKGALTPMEPGLAARFFLYTIFLYVADLQLSFAGPPPLTNREQAAQTVVDLFLRGLLPRC